MSDMCDHGYKFGMCPEGCHEPVSTASAETPLEPETITRELQCAICDKPVSEGTVYKGKPICNSCMSGMKGEKAEPAEVQTPGMPVEEIKKKFPMQGEGLPKKGTM